MEAKNASMPPREWHYKLPEIGRTIGGIAYSVGIGIIETDDEKGMTALCELVKEDLDGNRLGALICGSVSEAVKYLNELERRTGSDARIKDRLGHCAAAVYRAGL